MSELGSQNIIVVLSILCLLALVLQICIAAYLYISSRASHKAMNDSVRELYGIMKKIEGLTATRREQLMLEFDRIVQTLSLRLPTVVSAHVGDAVFDAESKILKRLAEVDPSIKDEKNKEKMDELIKSLEGLQESLVTVTTETVRKALLDARKDLPVESESSDTL